jgi:hypothetical protein
VSAACEYVRIAEGGPLPDIKAYRPFKALVVIDNPASSDFQARASRWLVDSGCLEMMAWGENCAGWDESVDWANSKQFDHGYIPDEHEVLTSWAEDEPLKDVFWSAQNGLPEWDARTPHTLIIHVSTEDKRGEMLALYAAAGDPHYIPD